MQGKACTKCKETKALDNFRKSKKGDRFGLHSWCIECMRQDRRDRYRANPERDRMFSDRWKQSNSDRVREYNRIAWQSIDRDALNERRRERRKSNPDLYRALEHNYRARKRNAEGVLTAAVIAEVFKLHGDSCLACGATENIQIDHVVPLALGGTNLIDNLQPLCISCNSSKGARSCVDYRRASVNG